MYNMNPTFSIHDFHQHVSSTVISANPPHFLIPSTANSDDTLHPFTNNSHLHHCSVNTLQPVTDTSAPLHGPSQLVDPSCIELEGDNLLPI